MVASALVSSLTLHAAVPSAIGGSNYAWYGIDELVISNNGDRNCREKFGIIANYHLPQVRSTVRRQLSIMFDNGQRRLRVPIYHATDLASGTVLNSAGGNLQQQPRENLARFLADIQAAGFQEVLVGFFPISRSSPKNWYREYGSSNTSVKTWAYNSAAMQENWNLIKNLRPIIAGANIDYKIDLRNEGAAASSQPIDRQYASDIWSLYNASFGKQDTVGFSVATGSIAENASPDLSVKGNLAVDRYRVMKQVYEESGYGAPVVWDFHAYEFLSHKISKVDAAMTASGDYTDIIIGETFYQDSNTLSAIQSITTSRNIQAIYAWPVTTARGCDGHVDTPFPAEYLYTPGELMQATVSAIPSSSPQPVFIPFTEQPANTAPTAGADEPAEGNPTQFVSQCASGVTDTDGDGWGWENNASCFVTLPVPSGDGIGNMASDSSIPLCISGIADSDGDGWGWEGNRSCVVDKQSKALEGGSESFMIPYCEMNYSDTDGDGWGWEKNSSCLVK
ncbi:hypothetical protein AB833_06180 [Chromatiales bacterium (ex Bugula neritina AB1)]|nr:hypothetical protein AB833_06180 [Chromatiales bacterium (ex Bugula neritina AB1)]